MDNRKIFIITAPSGSGKTTLVKLLLEHCSKLKFCVSACTRSPRPGEINGKDYHFYEVSQFHILIEQNAFAEWEMVYPGKYYGTLRSELESAWEENKAPLVDIDVHGAIALREQYTEQAVTIFIKAPSLEAIQERLKRRGTETDKSIEERVTKAAYELSFADQFQHIVINDQLEEALKRLIEIVENSFSAVA